MLKLTKTEISERVGLVLTKKSIPTPPPCNVVAFLDVSGSFEDEWKDGLVGQVFSRLMAVASRFDDDGNVPLYLFHNSVLPRGIVSFAEMPEDAGAAIKWLWNKAGSFSWGGTQFAPIFEALLPTTKEVKTGGFLGGLFGGGKKTVAVEAAVKQAADPCVVYVITDGDAQDYARARQLAMQMADKRTYIMFVNVSQMAECAVRLSDEFGHVGHIFLGDLNRVNDDQLIEALMTDEFVQWRKRMG